MLIYWDGEQVREHTKIYVDDTDDCIGKPCIDTEDRDPNMRYGMWEKILFANLSPIWTSIPLEDFPKQLRTYELLLGGVPR